MRTERPKERIAVPVITEGIIRQCLDEIPVKIDEEYIVAFILNGQAKLQVMIHSAGPDENTPKK